MKKRALISVSDKNGIKELAKEISNLGYEIISTGGTYNLLKKEGLEILNISEVTNFPECLDGRVKTLHPYVHAGLLAMRSNREHMKQLEILNINTIDIVIVNLYPFKETISKENVEFCDAVENIDIGGPTMLRSAAKNYQDVIVLVDPNDYGLVLSELKNGNVSMDTRKYLMYKVFQHTSVYDTLISTYLREKLNIIFPEQITFAFEKKQDMRYGENPHQKAAFYEDVLPLKNSIAQAVQLNGKELSYNNINDTNAAIELVKEFTKPTAVAIKHANPCGVASDESIYKAYLRAFAADPISIFGGIVAFNGNVDEDTANELSKTFLEVIVAPSYAEKALDILKKKNNLRILELSGLNSMINPLTTMEVKKVYGGLLYQSVDNKLIDEIKVVTKKAPTAEQLESMEFGMKIVKHCKSNAIVIVDNEATVGIGVGQTNRIWATTQAIEHSLKKLDNAVLCSDAFFPFSDCPTKAIEANIKAIVQPGGSVRDQESIDVCDKNNISMVFTGVRHFKH